jgi:hypothetical protein
MKVDILAAAICVSITATSPVLAQGVCPEDDPFCHAARVLAERADSERALEILRAHAAQQGTTIETQAQRLGHLAAQNALMADSIAALLELVGQTPQSRIGSAGVRFVPVRQNGDANPTSNQGAGGVIVDGVFLGLYQIEPVTLRMTLPLGERRPVIITFEPFPWERNERPSSTPFQEVVEEGVEWFMRVRTTSTDTSIATSIRDVELPDTMQLFPNHGSTSVRWLVGAQSRKYDTAVFNIDALVGSRRSSQDSIVWDVRGWRQIAAVQASPPVPRRLIDIVKDYLAILTGLSGLLVGAVGSGWLLKLRDHKKPAKSPEGLAPGGAENAAATPEITAKGEVPRKEAQNA